MVVVLTGDRGGGWVVMVGRCWVDGGCVCVYQRKKKMMRERRCLSWFCRWRREREKKGAKCEINKILVCKTTVTMHIYTITVAICIYAQFCKYWCECFFSWLKCVKLITFYILHNFTASNAVALKKIYGEHCKQIIILYILDDHTPLKILAHLAILPTTIMFTVSASCSKISSTLAWFVSLDRLLNTPS